MFSSMSQYVRYNAAPFDLNHLSWATSESPPTTCPYCLSHVTGSALCLNLSISPSISQVLDSELMAPARKRRRRDIQSKLRRVLARMARRMTVHRARSFWLATFRELAKIRRQEGQVKSRHVHRVLDALYGIFCKPSVSVMSHHPYGLFHSLTMICQCFQQPLVLSGPAYYQTSVCPHFHSLY